MGLMLQLPAHAAARTLERALGDPFAPDGPVSFGNLIEHDEREAAPTEAFSYLHRWGAHAHLVPQAFGGRLTSFEELLALTRVLSRRDLVLTTGLGSTMLASIPVWAWGGDEQREQVSSLLLGAGAFGSFAVSEREAGSDFQATKASAETVPGGYVLRGEKWLIGNASRSAFVVALVRTQPALSLLLFRPDELPSGALRRLPRIRTLGLRGHDMAGMVFADCPLPASALLGRTGRGMEMVLTTLQYTRTMIAAMALGAADTALRLALGWGRDRRLYGQPIIAIPAVRTMLLGSFLDLLIAECVAMVTARALTVAPRRTSLWAAVTKYLVPNLCERIVRDAAVVLSARSYLREGIAGGIFQKIARDVAITSIFEGTQLVQLALISSQLGQLTRTARRADHAVDLDLLCDLGTPAPAWEPSSTGLRISDPGGDELVERWFGQSEAPEVGSRAGAALRSLRRSLIHRPPAAELSLARRHCDMHAAACCLQLWHSSRHLLVPEATGGEWLALCLERLATGSEMEFSSDDLNGPVCSWMLGQLDRNELFSITPFGLAG